VPALLRAGISTSSALIAYGILSVLATAPSNGTAAAAAALAFLLALLVGFADEGIQMLGTRRTADDSTGRHAAGAFTGSIVTHLRRAGQRVRAVAGRTIYTASAQC